MSFVVTQPESRAAARDLHAVGEAIPAAADEVSALTATQFAMQAQTYQQVSAQSVAVHEVFATTLAIGAGSYAATEAANVIAAR
jgi:hypothetical protein